MQQLAQQRRSQLVRLARLATQAHPSAGAHDVGLQLLMQQLLRGSLSDIDLALTSSGSEEGSLGMLDVLSEDLLIMVLRHVDNTPSLLKICTVLSKRLRSLRYNQSLWQSLEVYNSGFSETGLRQLVQWLHMQHLS